MNLKSLIGLVYDAGGPKDSPAQGSTPPARSPSTLSHPTPPSGTPPPAPAAREQVTTDNTDRFNDHFEKLFDAANLPGPDYHEFSRSMDKLKAHVPDESARRSAVMDMLAVQGLTKETLLSSGEKYVAIVEADKSAFQSRVKLAADKDVEPHRTKLRETEAAIVQHKLDMEELRKSLDSKEKSLDFLRKEVSEAEARLEAAVGGYEAAHARKIARIREDLRAIAATA